MEVVTIAVDKSTILEIRKTIALLFQSSLTALVGAIITVAHKGQRFYLKM